MDLETVLYEVDGPVATITLNRPEKLNAISEQLRVDVEAALAEADKGDDIRVVILKGQGRAFCAGYDISPASPNQYNAERSIAADRDSLRTSVERWLAIWNFRKPIVAQVHGYCLAGGGEMAGMCDIIFCAEDAQFGHPAGRSMGIPPTLGLWPIKIGMLKSKELLLTGDTITGTEAERIGMVNKAVPATELEAFTKAWARRVAMVPMDALTVHKHVVNRWFEIMGLRTGAAEGAEFDAIYHMTPSFAEFSQIAREKGLKAALEWRDAKFR
ncbi:MAG TPA: enoyl-CoA hydratase-related protein [Tepidiformaceae bacterium]|nr:enoyl-CoA hydratase-related protein [Tepidiformaceae bacterium]